MQDSIYHMTLFAIFALNIKISPSENATFFHGRQRKTEFIKVFCIFNPLVDCRC